MGEEDLRMKKEQKAEQLKGWVSRSEEVQEVMGRKNHWLCRWGMGIIFVFFLLFCVTCMYWTYPDYISCKAVIASGIELMEIKSPVEAEIRSIRLENEFQVEPGDTLAELCRSDEDIFFLKALQGGTVYKTDLFDSGTQVKASTPLFVLLHATGDSICCKAYLPRDKRQKLHIGQTAILKDSEQGRSFAGRVARMTDRPLYNKELYAVLFSFPIHREDRFLPQGDSVQIQIRISDRSVFEHIFGHIFKIR